MTTRILTSDDCERLVDHAGLVDALQTVHAQLATGGAVQPVPQKLRVPGDTTDDGPTVVPMSSFAPYLDRAAVKILIDAPRNRAEGLPPQRSTVSLYSASTGECLALVDGRALTRIRTAAVTALATRTLARADSTVLGIVGAGPLAREHVRFLREVLPFREVRIWSPSGTSAAHLADEVTGEGFRAVAAGAVEEVVVGADVVCTLTPSRDPIIDASWILPGLHLNAVGSPPRPGYREIGGDVFARADVLAVDSRAVALAESDNVVQALRAGQLEAGRVAELGEILAGSAAGRDDAGQFTLFNSIGIGLQDLAAAAYLLERAESLGVGATIDVRP